MSAAGSGRTGRSLGERPARPARTVRVRIGRAGTTVRPSARCAAEPGFTPTAGACPVRESQHFYRDVRERTSGSTIVDRTCSRAPHGRATRL